MSVPVSVHQPAPDRTLAVWLDSPPDLSSANSTQGYWADVDHQPTDLAVGVRIPRGAHNTPSQRPGSSFACPSDRPFGGWRRPRRRLGEDAPRGCRRSARPHPWSRLTETVAPRLGAGDLAPDRQPVVGDERGDHGHTEDGEQGAQQGPSGEPDQGQPEASADGAGPHRIDGGTEQPRLTAHVPPDDVEQNGRQQERQAVEDDGGTLPMPGPQGGGQHAGANGRNAMSISSRVLRNNTVRSTTRMWSNMT